MFELTPAEKRLADALITTTVSDVKITRRLGTDPSNYYLHQELRTMPVVGFPTLEGDFAGRVHREDISAPLLPIYFSLRNLPEELLQLIAEQMAGQLSTFEMPDIIAPIPNAGNDIAVALAVKTGISYREILQKNGDQLIPNPDVLRNPPVYTNCKVLYVDDVANQGHAKIEALAVGEKTGYKPVGISVVMDRDSGATQVLEQDGIQLNSLLHLIPTMIDYRRNDRVTNDQYTAVMKYIGRM